jgi:DNA (cytosine-5)-methyltransferase 1
MTRPRLLDLFCGAGGAAMGYYRAGFDVVGVDIKPQPRYPFEFHQGDAMTWPLDGFDAIHASPPCQQYMKSPLRALVTRPHLRLIEPMRQRLSSTGLPWVIENVPGAPLPHQSTLDGAYGIELCGTMFSRRIQRHRLFETSFPIAPPRGCDHSVSVMNPYDAGWRRQWQGVNCWKAWRAEMGVEWMDQATGQEAIPPAYTEHIGRQLLDILERAA